MTLFLLPVCSLQNTVRDSRSRPDGSGNLMTPSRPACGPTILNGRRGLRMRTG